MIQSITDVYTLRSQDPHAKWTVSKLDDWRMRIDVHESPECVIELQNETDQHMYIIVSVDIREVTGGSQAPERGFILAPGENMTLTHWRIYYDHPPLFDFKALKPIVLGTSPDDEEEKIAAAIVSVEIHQDNEIYEGTYACLIE